MESVAEVREILAMVVDRYALENEGVGLATLITGGEEVCNNIALVKAATSLDRVRARNEVEVVNEELAEESASRRVVVESGVAL